MSPETPAGLELYQHQLQILTVFLTEDKLVLSNLISIPHLAQEARKTDIPAQERVCL